MLDDYNSCDQGLVLDTDVCIVGAGAAGITLARELVAAGIDVCILESGGTDHEPAVQDMADGTSVGYPYYPLVDSRLRFFGGTTSIWGGRVAQLDRIDFDRRTWVADSGWPFGKSVLAPYYAKAQRQLDVAEIYGSDNMAAKLGHDAKPFDPGLLRTAFWQFDEQSERFTIRRCDDLINSDKVRILLHATVVDIATGSDGNKIESMEIANLRGTRSRVRAKTFVLAAGGLENPRLLLNANSVHKNGLGNAHDLVGRYFMEHPRARGARVCSDLAPALLQMFPRLNRQNGYRYAALLRGSERLQEREGLLNTSFSLSVRQPPNDRLVLYKRVYRALKERLPPNRIGRSMWQLVRQASVRGREKLLPLSHLAPASRQRDNLYVVIRAEQAPNPDSRVTLSNERDAMGVPRIELDWKFSEIDKRTVAVLMDTFDSELRRCGLGKLERSPWLADDGPEWETDPLISNHPIGGYHHIGTTRMSSSPRQGVVDSNCRVHGLSNLYIAGSSVFPTGGWANPTLTIIALALRLGGEITNTIKRPVPTSARQDDVARQAVTHLKHSDSNRAQSLEANTSTS